MTDPGHLAAEPRRPRGLVLLILAPVLAVVALIAAFLPIGSFVAGLPALAAIVLAIIALVLGARRLVPALAVLVAVVALVVAVAVSIGQVVAAVQGVADRLPSFDDPPTRLPSPSAGALSAGPHRITYEVLGDGAARITYSAFLGGRAGTSSEADVAVPHARTQRVTIADRGEPVRFSMIASRAASSDRAGSLGCRISIDGRVVDEHPPSKGTAVPIAVCAATPSG